MEDEKDNLRILPVWKKGSSAEDWFLDMAVQARKNPKKFEKMALVFQTTKPNGNITTSYYCHGPNGIMTTTELVGLLEIGKWEVITYAERGA